MKKLRKKSWREESAEGSQGLKPLREFKEKEKIVGRICYCWACKVQFEDEDMVEVRVKQTSEGDAPWLHAYCPRPRGIFGSPCGQPLILDKEFTFKKNYHVLS